MGCCAGCLLGAQAAQGWKGLWALLVPHPWYKGLGDLSAGRWPHSCSETIDTFSMFPFSVRTNVLMSQVRGGWNSDSFVYSLVRRDWFGQRELSLGGLNFQVLWGQWGWWDLLVSTVFVNEVWGQVSGRTSCGLIALRDLLMKGLWEPYPRLAFTPAKT